MAGGFTAITAVVDELIVQSLVVGWWPGTLEFPEHTGVPGSQDCLIGAEGALPMQIWRAHFFCGGSKKKGCPKKYIPIHSAIDGAQN